MSEGGTIRGLFPGANATDGWMAGHDESAAAADPVNYGPDITFSLSPQIPGLVSNPNPGNNAGMQVEEATVNLDDHEYLAVQADSSDTEYLAVQGIDDSSEFSNGDAHNAFFAELSLDQISEVSVDADEYLTVDGAETAGGSDDEVYAKERAGSQNSPPDPEPPAKPEPNHFGPGEFEPSFGWGFENLKSIQSRDETPVELGDTIEFLAIIGAVQGARAPDKTVSRMLSQRTGTLYC